MWLLVSTIFIVHHDFHHHSFADPSHHMAKSYCFSLMNYNRVTLQIP